MTLFLPIGPPASGKSVLVADATLHRIRSGDPEAWNLEHHAIIEPDSLRERLTGDRGDQTANESVFQIAHTTAAERLSRGLDVWVDATNLVPGHRWPFEEAASLLGQPILRILMSAEEGTCVARNAARKSPVPDAVMETMFVRFQFILHNLNAWTGPDVTPWCWDHEFFRNTPTTRKAPPQ